MRSFSLVGVNPRSIYVRLIALGTLITFMFVVYTYSSASFATLPKFSIPFLSEGRTRASCPATSWADGKWTYRPRSNLTNMTAPIDALAMDGLDGCASSREYFWHLASDTPAQWDRFPKVASYDWSPGQGCDVRPFNREDMVRDLVEQGGWMLLGDSITEGHFFSLSCLLYPHVRATPNYTENPYFDRAWPQNLYLDPSSPLLPTLSLPTGFNISRTPLITFRRIDLLLNHTELTDLHRKLYNPPDNFTLISEEKYWSMSPSEYMPMFTAPLPDANYATLIASTGGHWTTTLFSGFRDESKGEDAGYGVEDVITFFGHAMRKWADDVQHALTEDRRVQTNAGSKKTRQAVVRAYLPGHDDCHNWREPWTEDQGFKWHWYNWAWIKDYNKVFQALLTTPKYPDIHYLPIDRPARLRPDAHATGDCLHIMAGVGVMEGWSHYIWHFVTRELVGRVR
ncbi:hypothetical protein PLICRDRAFT_172323 [Plicaturopsis crispa FD-325 SS-3]|nr:hypothetical protein PLICRDRAFT_172323 [Plicaturopsis crispa FD-325 SS-3]